MTKTLTEQWRDGEWIVCNAGKCDYYYTDVKCYNGSHKEVIKEESVFLSDYDPDYEILGKVPSYEKVKEMSQKIERLEFDNEALEMAHNEGKEINAELSSKNEQLEKKLAIATKALKSFIPDDISDGGFGEMYEDVIWDCKKALKEMEDVK